jgi:hypothetical protein
MKYVLLTYSATVVSTMKTETNKHAFGKKKDLFKNGISDLELHSCLP